MSQNQTIILAIESSCDDTSVSVIKNYTVLSNLIACQSIHSEYGGVIPELASRAHLKNIIPVVDTAIKRAGITIDKIDAVAFTKGPGLLGSLIVGTSFAKSMALALNIPLIDVNHMYGHVLAHFIDDEKKNKPTFPFLCLTVSGGHTQIVLVHSPLNMEVVGSTIDDAAGEAFDKSAKILGFEYPGGPLIDENAKNGDHNRFKFAKPKVAGFNYSFSGLKTSILYFIKKNEKKNRNFISDNLNDLCASIQHSIVYVLLDKLIKSAEFYGIDNIAIAGGVSANSYLRDKIKEEGCNRGWEIFIPKFEYCTDNAAMIGVAAKFMYDKKMFVDQSVSAQSRVAFSPNGR